MLTLYLIALALGGTLLLASLFLGGEHDAGAPGEVSPDMDADLSAGDADMDAGEGGELGADVALAWLPVASMRFWTFFLAFFGLTGTILTLGGVVASAVITGVIAGGVGYACGMGVVQVIRRMRATQTDSTAGADDYIGETALVMVSVARGKTGKVRLEVKGRTVDLLAETEDERPFAARERALVYAMNDDGHAVITRAEHAVA